MKYTTFAILLYALFCVSCKSKSSSMQQNDKIKVEYPSTMKDTSIVENYHGTSMADPYRWLEDDNSDETMAWVDDQNEVTFSYLDQIPFRKPLRDRLEHIWNYEKFSAPFKRNGKYYFFKNDGLQNQSVLYVQNSLEDDVKLFLDPNKLSDDGTTSLSGFDFSKDGKYFAYLISEGGSDWRKARVMDIESGETLEDEIDWIKFSGLQFYKDGFYYSRYPEPNEGDELSARNQNQKVYYHKIGTAQEDDQLVYEEPSHPNRGFGAATSEDEAYLVLSAWESTSGNDLYFKSLNNDNAELKKLVGKIEKDYVFVDHINDRFLIMTNEGADNNRLIAVDPNRPLKENWVTVIPERQERLQGVSIRGGKLVATYLKNASSHIEVLDLDGKLIRTVDLPGIGTVGGFSGKNEESEAFYVFSSFNTPATIYSYDMETGGTELFKQPKLDFDPSQFETKQVWFSSKDGTKVPMFITHKKGLVLDGSRPTLLYGYGGFDISILPSFSVSRMILLENDGVYAVANIRGGGEFGAKWHKSGTLGQKQNVFDDFIAASEYLIDNKFTNSGKLAIEGGSNGGLLVGACMTQRPDLYAVAIPRVGVLDMLRYDKFTIGRAWSTDYGLSEEKEAFEYLKKYSPLHNVKEIEYPATFVMTADHDDRVVPAHSFKFAATVQEHQQGENPVLIRVDKSAGHGAGVPTSKIIDASADAMSFMLYNMGEQTKYKVIED